jgi:23S rRNA pseudouridine2605 synthase
MAERLQKILAHAGVASRRAAEQLIVDGRVRVNGRIVTELGATATRRDRVEVDGKRIVHEKPVYYIFHKPRGVVSTMSDPEGRPSLADAFGKVGARVYPIGRLDFHTSGVLLLTNDGEFADALLHPSKKVPKVYVAKVNGDLDEKALQSLRMGVVLDDGEKTAKADVIVLSEDDRTWIRVTLYEGKNRQIHRMMEAVGRRVMRLARIEFAGLDHEGLRPGMFRELDVKELERLKKDYVLPARGRKQNLAKRAGKPDASLFDDEPEEIEAPKPPAARSAQSAKGKRPERAPVKEVARPSRAEVETVRKTRSFGPGIKGKRATRPFAEPAPLPEERARGAVKERPRRRVER